MNFKPDISILLNYLYGVSQPVYTIPGSDPNSGIVFSGVETVPLDEASRKSQYGHPVMFPFSFKGKTYKTFSNTGELVDYHLPDFELPSSTLVEFTRSKKIQSTDISSGDGSILELVGFTNWMISIRGVCYLDTSRANSKSAQEQYESLLAWEKVAGHVEIASGDLFVDKGIYALVIESFRLAQVEGAGNSIIPFEMSCISDRPLELKL